MDDIEAIAKLGLKKSIPVHVDACLGSFVVALSSAAGYDLNPFDFSVEGVTSISVDTHKVKRNKWYSNFEKEKKLTHFTGTCSMVWLRRDPP